MKTSAILLAAGSGSRMGSDTKKQYMLLQDKPLLYYSLKAFEDSFIDEVILVTAKEDFEYCRTEIIDKYDFKKVRRIVEGGKERYNSVANGLKSISECDYVFIHDGARPFVDQEMLQNLLTAVQRYGSAVAASPSKDTVKIIDSDGYVISTPNRKTVYNVQTPQVFPYGTLTESYERMSRRARDLTDMGIAITDDAMVVENFSNTRVKLVECSYKNIKITTPDDMVLAEMFLKN